MWFAWIGILLSIILFVKEGKEPTIAGGASATPVV
jgi:hypothetical protein